MYKKTSGFKWGSWIVVLAIALMPFNETENISAQPESAIPAQNDLPAEARAPLLNITAISAGGTHTCALTTGGGVKCWGRNNYGQLGDGTLNNRWAPVDVSGLASGVIAISAGDHHTCALTDTGGVKCWGRNKDGELGDGTATNSSTPVDVNGLVSGIIQVSAGSGNINNDFGSHTCALTEADGVKCWGRNKNGELGDGTTINRLTPVDVSGLSSGVVTIEAGWQYTCAVTAEGGAKCWGWNNVGQLGDGTQINRTTPVNVTGLTSEVGAIATGGTNLGSHTCALTVVGGIKCWGGNISGELGDGTTTRRLTPVDVIGLASGVDAIATGGSYTCALTSGGVKCWGMNQFGTLGNGSGFPGDYETTPVDVFGLASGISAITTGKIHACALTTIGGVKCWGHNMYGQLGDGTLFHRNTPVDVLNDAPAFQTVWFFSTASQDGWALESTETSNIGGTMDVAADGFYVGDDAENREYRAILSFNTSELPRGALVTKVRLMIKMKGLSGVDPFNVPQLMRVAIKNGAFSNNSALELTDFEASACRHWVGNFRKHATIPDWHIAQLHSKAFPCVNKYGGITQFRLYFPLDDNDNLIADYLEFFSGDTGNWADRPRLIIYYTP